MSSRLQGGRTPQTGQRSDGASRAAAQSPNKKKADQLAADVAVKKMAGNGAKAAAPPPAPDGERPVRVLVTGYGPFMGIDPNPTQEIAEKLAFIKIPGAEIKTKVLTVSWADVDSFVAGELQSYKPDVVVSMGFSAGHHEIKEYATNQRSGRDANGVEGGFQKIDENGPDFRHTTLPVDRINKDQAAAFQGDQADHRLDDVDHTEPDDDYLCNFIEYRELSALQGTGAEAGFLHISDVERDLPAVIQLIRSAVAEVQEQRKKKPAVTQQDVATPDAPKPPGGAGG
jgi:pyroglutamyl-peptidase